MKKLIKTCSVVVALLAMLAMVSSCNKDGNGDDKGEKPGQEIISPDLLPVNITVLLDLSDRLERNLTPSQLERDTAIVNYFVDVFSEKTTENKGLLTSKNAIRVLFYPTPDVSGLAALANNLNVDLSNCKNPGERKSKLKSMKQDFNNSLRVIYNKTLAAKQWVGCDIWGFFSGASPKVDSYCIKEGYRNILVILTDGFIYHANNKIIETGGVQSFITPNTVSNMTTLKVDRKKGLENLEVLMLEVNPFDQTLESKQINILEKWFSDMKVKKFVVSTTDIPVNTKSVIDNFMK